MQGFGAGLNIVALYVVVGRLYPDAMRPRLFSAMSSAWVSRRSSGRRSRVVADELSWRWVFLAVPPLLVAPAVALMLPRLHGLGRGRAGTGSVRSRTLPALAVAFGVAVAAVRRPAAGPLRSWALPASAPACWCGAAAAVPPGIFRVRRGLPTAVLLRGILAGAFFGRRRSSR